MVSRDNFLIKAFDSKEQAISNKHLKCYLENSAFMEQIFIVQLLYVLVVGDIYLTDERRSEVDGKLHYRMIRTIVDRNVRELWEHILGQEVAF